MERLGCRESAALSAAGRLSLSVVVVPQMEQGELLMRSYLEHANISVTDVDKAVRFFHSAMPDFQVRHDSGPGPERWVHLGTDTSYIAINQMPPSANQTFQYHQPGYNHIGFVVDDADVLRERMLAAGYREGFIPPPHPHRKRVYFLDSDGIEYEFVQVLYRRCGPEKRLQSLSTRP